ncbi:hypothetical protein KW801_00850 [Candidatus Saccharibacteria bacterium]|nr:hypothetical protein [Candidatus Saccharibacteria bacterium]
MRVPTISRGQLLAINKRRLVYTLIQALIVLFIIAFAYNHIFRTNLFGSSGGHSPTADDADIKAFKNSQNINDKKVLISAYEDKKDYAKALTIAKDVADKSRTYQDYMTVLSICALYDVPDKQSCLSQTAANLKPLLSSMPFSSAYAAGALLEKNNLKKQAADFYQRAYDTYSPDPNAENMMSKEQLKNHIDELRK